MKLKNGELKNFIDILPNGITEPFEMDDHYGVTLAALAVGIAPGEYAETEAAQRGMDGIRRYFSSTPPETLHQQAMLLWAATYTPELMTDAEKQDCMDELFARQQPDGGAPPQSVSRDTPSPQSRPERGMRALRRSQFN